MFPAPVATVKPVKFQGGIEIVVMVVHLIHWLYLENVIFFTGDTTGKESGNS